MNTNNNKGGVQTDASTSVKTIAIEQPVVAVPVIAQFDWTKFIAPAGDYVGLYDRQTGALKKALPESYASPLGWLAAPAGSQWLNQRGNPCMDKLGIRISSEKTMLVVRSITDTHKKLFVGTLGSAKKLADLADRKAAMEATFDAEVTASLKGEIYVHEDINVSAKGHPLTSTKAVEDLSGLDL